MDRSDVIVGIDIDGIFCNAHEEALRQLKEKGVIPDSVTKEDCKTWNLEWDEVNKTGLPNVTAEMVDNIFSSPKTYADSDPIVDAIEAINKLNDRAITVLVTSRSDTPELKKVTEDWLAKNKVKYDNLYMTKKKSYVCSELRLLYFIEDNVKYADDIAPHVEKVYLIDQPWNREAKVLFSNNTLKIDSVSSAVEDIITNIDKAEKTVETVRQKLKV